MEVKRHYITNILNLNETTDLKTGDDKTKVISDTTEKFFENFEKLKWLTSSEATVYLRIPSLNALRQLVYRRKIPFYKIGRKLLFNRAELDLFIQSQSVRRI